jgi:nucleotide-binding universal stress UspA family protein
LYQRILVPHDGSAFAEMVLPHVTELAQRFEAELCLLEVIEPPNPALYASDAEAGMAAELAVEEIDRAQDELRADGTTRLASLVDKLQGQGIRASFAVVDGHPAREILGFARENNVDLIAMTSHGRTGLARAVLGSVTDMVLREADVPVLIVRAKER